jgi:hypothetical protein
MCVPSSTAEKVPVVLVVGQLFGGGGLASTAASRTGVPVSAPASGRPVVASSPASAPDPDPPSGRTPDDPELEDPELDDPTPEDDPDPEEEPTPPELEEELEPGAPLELDPAPEDEVPPELDDAVPELFPLSPAVSSALEPQPAVNARLTAPTHTRACIFIAGTLVQISAVSASARETVQRAFVRHAISDPRIEFQSRNSCWRAAPPIFFPRADSFSSVEPPLTAGCESFFIAEAGASSRLGDRHGHRTSSLGAPGVPRKAGNQESFESCHFVQSVRALAGQSGGKASEAPSVKVMDG